MTTNEINNAIAEACGWKPVLICLDFNGNPFEGQSTPPNYAESLDACAEFERTLTDDGQLRFAVSLAKICADDFWEHKTHWSPNPIHAKPAQRAEAFLKIKGLWMEGK